MEPAQDVPQATIDVVNIEARSNFRSCCIVTCFGEIVWAFLRGEAAQGVGDGLPEVGDGSRGGGAQQRLELGEGRFDGIESGL